MKKFLLTLLIAAGFAAEGTSNYFVDNFLKYSTFYGGFSLNSPLKTNTQF